MRPNKPFANARGSDRSPDREGGVAPDRASSPQRSLVSESRTVCLFAARGKTSFLAKALRRKERNAMHWRSACMPLRMAAISKRTQVLLWILAAGAAIALLVVTVMGGALPPRARASTPPRGGRTKGGAPLPL